MRRTRSGSELHAEDLDIQAIKRHATYAPSSGPAPFFFKEGKTPFGTQIDDSVLLYAAAETLWDIKSTKCPQNGFFFSWRTSSPPTPTRKATTSRSNRCFSIGDRVVVRGVNEGKAKLRNGCQGTVRSHKAQSPWYMVYFEKDRQIIPVRSQNLVMVRSSDTE